MNSESALSITISWSFGLIIFALGVLNLILVHPVPGAIYLLLSLIFFPPVNKLLRKRAGFSVPLIARIILGLLILWFTLGVGDLAEMYGL